ncbi:MAG: signal peptidase II [Eggerthellaceae bacterium]|nr:signal peptidase II [Eggerthellaceae bacterium]
MQRRKRNTIIFFVIAALWLVFDRVTKGYFDSAYTQGQTITESILGIFRFVLVHNTGAAWGIFNESTFLLGVSSAVVCAVILLAFVIVAKRINLAEALGLALVFAGGIGNGVDRFVSGYVVDFIEFTFINFPVFNIADMGVTCGFVIFVIGMLAHKHPESKTESETATPDDAERFV